MKIEICLNKLFDGHWRVDCVPLGITVFGATPCQAFVAFFLECAQESQEREGVEVDE